MVKDNVLDKILKRYKIMFTVRDLDNRRRSLGLYTARLGQVWFVEMNVVKIIDCGQGAMKYKVYQSFFMVWYCL